MITLEKAKALEKNFFYSGNFSEGTFYFKYFVDKENVRHVFEQRGYIVEDVKRDTDRFNTGLTIKVNGNKK